MKKEKGTKQGQTHWLVISIVNNEMFNDKNIKTCYSYMLTT